jgi:hypothetical protein
MLSPRGLPGRGTSGPASPLLLQYMLIGYSGPLIKFVWFYLKKSLASPKGPIETVKFKKIKKEFNVY